MASLADGECRTLPRLWARANSTSPDPLCDVRICGLSAHAFVLAAASPVLANLLASGSTLSPLHSASSSVRHAALAAAYYEYAPLRALSPPALIELAALCSTLSLNGAIPVVDAALRAAVAPAAALPLWRSVERLPLPGALRACRELVKRDIRAVSETDAWTSLPVAQLARILRIHDLSPGEEESVFRALERWLAKDMPARSTHAAALLRLIRFPTMSDRALLRVARSPYFAGMNEFYQLLLEAFIRRAEVRLIHAPRVAGARGGRFANAFVADWSLGAITPDGNAVNKKDQRAVMFQGLFPLRWYKNVRFRTRSAGSMLFTVVIPKWSQCRKRVRSESRSFHNHKWSLWIDPYASTAAGGAQSASEKPVAEASASGKRHAGGRIDDDHEAVSRQDSAAVHTGHGFHVGSESAPPGDNYDRELLSIHARLAGRPVPSFEPGPAGQHEQHAHPTVHHLQHTAEASHAAAHQQEIRTHEAHEKDEHPHHVQSHESHHAHHVHREHEGHTREHVQEAHALTSGHHELHSHHQLETHAEDPRRGSHVVDVHHAAASGHTMESHQDHSHQSHHQHATVQHASDPSLHLDFRHGHHRVEREVQRLEQLARSHAAGAEHHVHDAQRHAHEHHAYEHHGHASALQHHVPEHAGHGEQHYAEEAQAHRQALAYSTLLQSLHVPTEPSHETHSGHHGHHGHQPHHSIEQQSSGVHAREDEKEQEGIAKVEEGTHSLPQLKKDKSKAAASEEVAPEDDYISLFLCCESELGTTAKVNIRVDYALFVASATEDYGMERKVCLDRSFTAPGQAMGFRRHTRRAHLMDPALGLYNKEKDELIVGAHLVIPGMPSSNVQRPDVEACLSKATSEGSKRSSATTTSSWPRHSSDSRGSSMHYDPLRDLPEAANVHSSMGASLGPHGAAQQTPFLNPGTATMETVIIRGSSAVSTEDNICPESPGRQ